MTDFLTEIHSIPSFQTAIVGGISLLRSSRRVDINLVTERAFTDEDRERARAVARSYVPEEF